MSSLTAQLEEVERTATAATKSAPLLADAAKRVAKAAHTGDLVALKRALEHFRSVSSSFSEQASQTFRAWKFTRDEEEAYFAGAFETDLIDAASRAGFHVSKHERDLIAFPFIVRVLSREKAVIVNGKRTGSVKPSFIVSLLTNLRTRLKPSANEKFLDSLYAAYRLVSGPGAAGQPVTLAAIYEALTLLPGSSAAYTESEFVRDVYLLDRDGPRQTKNGASISLPASTGTRNRKGVYSFVGPEGERVEYFAIHFSEPRHEPLITP